MAATFNKGCRIKGFSEGFTNIKDPISKRKWKDNERIKMEIDERFATLDYLLESKDYNGF